jgi:hypothetical protein
MSNHCQFLTLETDGTARRVDSHPREDVVSDELGGSLVEAMALHVSRTAMWVRQDALAEMQPVNVVASVLATIMDAGDRGPLIVLGPACLTSLRPFVADGEVMQAAEGWPERTASVLLDVCLSLRAALDGSDGPFPVSDLPAGWGERVRLLTADLASVCLPDDWPFYGHVTSTDAPRDPVARLLGRAFPGRAYLPIPAPGGR